MSSCKGNETAPLKGILFFLKKKQQKTIYHSNVHYIFSSYTNCKCTECRAGVWVNCQLTTLCNFITPSYADTVRSRHPLPPSHPPLPDLTPTLHSYQTDSLADRRSRNSWWFNSLSLFSFADYLVKLNECPTISWVFS